jgi:hypothetical protein
VRWKALRARVSAGAHKQTLVQVWCGRRGRWEVVRWRVGALESPARKSVGWSPQADAGASVVWEEGEVVPGTAAAYGAYDAE